MLDHVDTAAKSEDLAEHKLGTELDRLAATELARMRRAIAAKERRVQHAYITAALENAAGTRYTPGELAAACGSAIDIALKSTRGMRLTADDWGDLRGDLMVAALERGKRCNLDRGERPSLMPRREDLAGKDLRAGVAYLAGAARRLLADIADHGATATEHRASTAETEAATAPDAPSDPVSMAALADALSATTRERWAMEAAGGAASADLAGEHGKTLGAMRVALTAGRNALRARTEPADLRTLAATLRATPADQAQGTVTMLRTRPLYPTERNRPTRREHGRTAPAWDVLRYIAEVEAAIVEVPAAALEAADLALRWTADTRRNAPAPRTTGGYLTADRPTALVPAPCTCQTGHPDAPCDGCEDMLHIVPAIGPVHVRTLQADLPTIERRAIAGRRYWQALGEPSRAPMPYSAPRTAAHVTTHADHVDAWTQPAPRTPNHHHSPAHREATPRTVTAITAPPTHTRAHGGALHTIAATLTANRTAAIAANRATREATRDGLKVTRLEATGRA